MTIILILGLFLFLLEIAWKIAIVVLAATAVKAFKKWNDKGPKTSLWSRVDKALKVLTTPYATPNGS